MFINFTKGKFLSQHIAIAMLFAGWVPSILMAVISYSILRNELDSKIGVERSTLVKAFSHIMGQNLVGTGEIMEHYQTLPQTREMLQRQANDPITQHWLAEVYYSQPRIDGMFLTNPDGALLASIPANLQITGQDFASNMWIEGARRSKGSYISPIHVRPSDNRVVTAVVVPVTSPTGGLYGYMGAHILIERFGKRLSGFNIGEQSIAQVFDQRGVPLFQNDFTPGYPLRDPADAKFIQQLHDSSDGILKTKENLYTYDAIEKTAWIAVLEQPVAVAYRPVRKLITRMALLAAWLLVVTAIAAWGVSQMYKQQVESDELIARETFFNEKILANMPMGIALIDPASKRFLQCNQSFVEIAQKFGELSPEQDILDLTFLDIKLGAERWLKNVIEFGVPYQAHEQSVISNTGKTHFLTINLLRLQDQHRRTQGILYLVQDNTAEVTIRKELIAANTSKDQFLALLSHELRNPLSPVIMMVAELERKTDGSPEYKSALEIIRRNVELEARLIDDLLDITRITHNKLQLTPEIIDAHQTIQRALEICTKDIETKGLRVTVDLQAKRHFVKADPARLQQVFWNLIKNSVKFTPVGRIFIRSQNDIQNHLVVEVQDTGIGFEPERSEKIFKAFEQGETSITRQFGGLGLGLAISRAMIDAHGGKLKAYSLGKGQGAMFTVELDTVIPAHAEPFTPKPRAKESHSNNEHKILLVDDHLDTCIGMKMLLERRGYKVRTAHNMASALALSQEEHFDLLISDIGLPDGSGFELMERVSKQSGLKGIALSGFGMESDITRSREAGFSEHLIKPVNLERLDTILKEIFNA